MVVAGGFEPPTKGLWVPGSFLDIIAFFMQILLYSKLRESRSYLKEDQDNITTGYLGIYW